MCFATIAAGASLAGGAIQAFGNIRQGQAESAQWSARQQELDREAQIQKTAAAQDSAERYRQLGRQIGTINALFGSRGLNPTSPSAMAIVSGDERAADTNIQRTAFNAQQQGENYRLAGQAAAASGSSALSAGWMKGIGGFFQTASQAYDIFGPKKKPATG